MGVNMARVAVGIDRAQNLGLRWRPGAAEETLRSPFGATSAFAVDGVGRAWGSTGNLAAVWDVDGTFYEFIDQHGVQAGARAANDTIAAGFAPEGSSLNAAHFRLPQSITRLPRVEGTGWRCFAQAINNQHVTVGSCSRIANASVSFATVWPNTTTIQSLNDVSNASFPFGNATGISDGGYIVGTSADRGWLLAPIAEPPALALHMNRGDFRPGESWQVSIDREGGPADLHVAIILPDGITTLVLTNIETLSYIVSTIARGPYPVTAGQALAYQWHGLEPHGVYHLVAALARPGSLADGRIDAGDLLALDWKAFSFSPGELIAGR